MNLLPGLRTGDDPDPRFSLANERTLLAWIRTALGFVAAGLVVHAAGEQTMPRELVTPVAIALLTAAGLISALAMRRWYRTEMAMRHHRSLPAPLLALPVVALLMVGVVGSGWLLLVR